MSPPLFILAPEIFSLTVASHGDAIWHQRVVKAYLCKNGISYQKTERWYLNLKYETHFRGEIVKFEDLNIFKKLGSIFGGI